MDSVSESQDSRTVTNQTAVAGPVENVMITVNPSQQLPQQQQQLTDFATTATDESAKQIPLVEGELEAQNPPPSDFDFSLPCQYFKSSFARSLSLNNSSGSGVNQSKSLDYINANKNGLQSTTPPPSVAVSNRKCLADSDSMMNGGSGNYDICPRTNQSGIAIATVPPIPARRQNIETSAVIPTASAVNGTHHLRNSCGSNISSANRVTAGNGSGSINSSMTCRVPHVANAGNGHFVRRNVCWPPAPPSSASSSGEQECHLLDEAEHEIKITGEYAENRFDVVDPSTNVEAVILQNQVDTLQWQLKQAETSCGMYRAVMEEVARFLDRFQKTSAHCRSEQISRSKSMYHVYGDHDKGSDSGNSSAYLRARSSTNLIDLKRMSPSPFGDESVKSSGEDHYSIASPISTYNTFKDFTYRRSPKKRGDQKLSPSDEIEEKLSKEAFRLSRTINNLLNTQQPDLTQHRQSLGPRSKTPTSNATVMPDVALHQKTSLSSEMLFLRTINMRDSRLSLRSSTDSSVHSTSSSSKVETDEENYSPPLLSKQCSNLCSTTEDESGFSSISSFQEIGVPLSSTIISNSTGSPHADNIIDQSDFNLDSRNSTLKAATIHHTSNNVGLPLTNDANRWDMKTYRNKCQRFSTLSNEDSSTVLWV